MVGKVRICSFLPSATEIVAELGLVESLVGVSEECRWPAEVVGLPVVTAARIDPSELSSVEIDEAVRERCATAVRCTPSMPSSSPSFRRT